MSTFPNISPDESTSPFIIQPKTTEDTKNFIEIHPLYAYTVKTNLSDDKTKELDINICTHESIAAPAMVTKLDKDGKPVEGLNIPVSIGEVCVSNGNAFHDIVFNPCILTDIKEDSTGKYRDFICRFAISSISNKVNANLSSKYTIDKVAEIQISSQNIRKPQPKIEKVSETINSSDGNDDEHSKAEKVDTAEIKVMIAHEYKITISLINSHLDDYMASRKRLDYNLNQFNDSLYLQPIDYNTSFDSVLVNCVVGERLTELPSISVSAYICNILISKDSEPITVYFPCIINYSKQVKVSVKVLTWNRTMISIIATIDRKPLSSIDIGSKPWTLSHALETDNDYTKHSHSNIESKSMVTNKSANSAVTDDEELPEDRFHRKDATSSYIINQRESQLNAKKSSSNSNDSSNSDSNVEYVDVEKMRKEMYEKKNENRTEVNTTPATVVCSPLLEMKSSLNLSSTIWTELELD